MPCFLGRTRGGRRTKRVYKSTTYTSKALTYYIMCNWTDSGTYSFNRWSYELESLRFGFLSEPADTRYIICWSSGSRRIRKTSRQSRWYECVFHNKAQPFSFQFRDDGRDVADQVDYKYVWKVSITNKLQLQPQLLCSWFQPHAIFPAYVPNTHNQCPVGILVWFRLVYIVGASLSKRAWVDKIRCWLWISFPNPAVESIWLDDRRFRW